MPWTFPLILGLIATTYTDRILYERASLKTPGASGVVNVCVRASSSMSSSQRNSMMPYGRTKANVRPRRSPDGLLQL